MKNTIVSILFTALCLVACNKFEKKAETFSESKPYTLVIKQERSYYQASKIAERLNKMGLESYILESESDDGTWYRIVSGAMKDSIEVASYVAMMDSTFQLTPLETLDYAVLDSLSRTPMISSNISEKHRIDANFPSVPKEIMNVTQKFPDNNMFYLKKAGVLSLSNASIANAKKNNLDMPRGISLEKLQEVGCTSMASVIYEDNLFGDHVTLQVIHCKNNRIEKASIVPSFSKSNKETLSLCSTLADLILATGEYQDERKEEFKVSSRSNLEGYKVSFNEKGGQRNYYLLTDKTGEYIYLAQSTKKDDAELMDFLSDIGKGKGLSEYDEFYNTFYTIADNPVDGDEFLGYYISRLGNEYARSKNYQKWAIRMVGHWETTMFFYNDSKKVWSVEMFDLLTPTSQEYIYNNLYRSRLDSNLKRKIYGVAGAAIYEIDWETIDLELSEINFGYDRFIVAISGSRLYKEKDLIHRAEALQLEKGGYSRSGEEDEADDYDEDFDWSEENWGD